MKHVTRWILLLSCLGLLVSSANAKGPSEKLALRTSGIAFSADAPPNLTPYKPSTWSDKIVVSKETGTNTDSAALSPTDSLYVDLTVLNNGGSATSARFYIELYLDGALNHTWYVDPPLEAGYYGYVEDYALGALSAGTHTLRVKVDSTNTVVEGDETDNEYTKSFTVGGAAAACVADSWTLCLNGGRFRVQVAFQTPSISSGIGTAVPLTADTGYFWFFSAGNVELAIKVLDGRAFNNKFWVFYGALSDVAYTITVTDTATGAVKTYSNPSGRLASVADTSAFAGLRAPGESGITPLTMAEAATAIWSARPLLVVGPNLTPFKPSAWSDRIVVSKETATNADSASLSPADTLYVDWAVLNNGTSPTAARFYTELYLDGVLRTTWYTDPPLDLMFYSYVEDYSIGTLSAGTHTIRIKTDSTGALAESDETDNEYTKTINVGGGGAGGCVADARTLCLNGCRYQVQVLFRTSSIPDGVGNAVSLTADSGYFWFFSSGNVELVVKALDGRAFNDRYWIFYGALSDVAYTIIVTDTVTGEVKIYANPAGNLASVADAAAFPLPAAAPIAHFEIDHPSIGELVLGVGVGDPASPSYSLPIAIRAGGARANVARDVDLRLCAAALPPTASYRWYLEAQDAASGNTGQIRVFRITSGGQTWTAGDTPVSIRDLEKSWSHIPSGLTPTPPTTSTPGFTPTPTPTPTTPTPGPGPGGNHAPSLDRLDSTRFVHSFGRDDALRSEGVAGRPGFGALLALTAPRVITLDVNHDGEPDITNAIVIAAANITSCCTLIVAEGAVDPDNDPMVYHWQAVTGTFYATGTDSSGGLAFGQKITDLDTYNRNSVFYELPSIGNIILEHTLMGGATTVGAFVTDVRAIPSQSLASPTRGCSLEWGRTVHLELVLLQSTLLPATHPTHPEGIEMILFANIVGNFLGNELPTYRGEVLHPDGRTVFDQDSTDNGGRIVLRFKRTEKGGTAQIAVVASTSGTSGANPFVKVPVSLNIPILDFWRSRGCTIGDVDVEKIEAKTGIAAIDVWDSGFIADDVFELTVDGVSLGRTPAGGDRLYTNLLLGSGTHNLCVVYVDCTVCSEDGTYTVRLAGGLTFTDGTTERRGNIPPWGTRPRPPYSQACFDFRVP